MALCSSGERLSAGEWDHVIFRGPALTVLLPADATGALCHVSRALRVPSPGLSRRHLLALIHAFYQVCQLLTRARASMLRRGPLCPSNVLDGAERITVSSGASMKRCHESVESYLHIW